LLQFDRQHQRFLRYRNSASPESIPSFGLTNLYENREGEIWAGVTDSGVIHFSSQPPSFQKLPRDLGNPSGNREAFIESLYEDQEGTLWIGTRQALSRLNLETGQGTRYHPAEPAIAPDVISVVEDHSDRFWAGTSTADFFSSTERQEITRPTGINRMIRAA
jgi:hypothetical protein